MVYNLYEGSYFKLHKVRTTDWLNSNLLTQLHAHEVRRYTLTKRRLTGRLFLGFESASSRTNTNPNCLDNKNRDVNQKGSEGRRPEETLPIISLGPEGRC